MIIDIIEEALEIIKDLSPKYRLALEKMVNAMSKEIARVNGLVEAQIENNKVVQSRLTACDAEIEKLKATIYQLKRREK